MAIYLYGIVRAPVSFPDPKTKGVDGGRVRTFEDGSLAAVVSDLGDVSFRAKRADLVAHSDVLQEVIQVADVLPMRFGTVFSSSDELLAGFVWPNQDGLLRMLDRLEGAVEVQLKCEYEPDVIAQDIVVGDRSIQKLQTRVKQRGDIESKIELGRRFATALDQKRYADGRRIIDTLSPFGVDVAVGEATGEYGMLNASFLVPRDQLERFDAEVEQARAAFGPRVKFRYLGPLPPYSFVDAGSMAVG